MTTAAGYGDSIEGSVMATNIHFSHGAAYVATSANDNDFSRKYFVVVSVGFGTRTHRCVAVPDVY